MRWLPEAGTSKSIATYSLWVRDSIYPRLSLAAMSIVLEIATPARNSRRHARAIGRALDATRNPSHDLYPDPLPPVTFPI